MTALNCGTQDQTSATSRSRISQVLSFQDFRGLYADVSCSESTEVAIVQRTFQCVAATAPTKTPSLRSERSVKENPRSLYTQALYSAATSWTTVMEWRPCHKVIKLNVLEKILCSFVISGLICIKSVDMCVLCF